MTSYPITYTLYVKAPAGPEYLRADDPVGRTLEAALRAEDTLPEVDAGSAGSLAEAVHQHLIAVAQRWSLPLASGPIAGFTVDLSAYEGSVWDIKHRVWYTGRYGASNIYVVLADGRPTAYRLAVATANAGFLKPGDAVQGGDFSEEIGAVPGSTSR